MPFAKRSSVWRKSWRRNAEMAAGSEFDLIREFFTHSGSAAEGVVLGVGDDCALLNIPAGMELAVSMDTLLEGVHFPDSTAATDVGYKALAVGLSDLAAMGAKPAWATLALTLPRSDRSWLRGFSAGFFSLAREQGVALVGGDTTRGPHTAITVQVHGLVPQGEALRRAGARCGDLVYVTGSLGDAALALHLMQQGIPVTEWLQWRLNRPTARVEQGAAVRKLASSCIDISDGLLADLGHILEASGVGGRLDLERLPLSRDYLACANTMEDRYRLALSGGDDYELCFTIPAEKKAQLEQLFTQQGWPCSCIGMIESQSGLRCFHSDGRQYLPDSKGYDHFA